MNTDTFSGDHQWMRQAIELSETALFDTAPNPRVACLIVFEGRLLASGVTQKVGGPHAEVMALRQAQERGLNVANSTFYVTLEPCSHYGRTPPCVDALIAAKPARVVVAMRDPNPLVAGQGIAKLRAAGIEVTVSICAEEALAVNPGFVARMVRKTPWLWLKLACSLDGRSALRGGQSKWITSSLARTDGHRWRARSSVVLTGLGTVQADNPQMTIHDVESSRPPIKALVDTYFRVDENARLFDAGETWLFTCRMDTDKAARLAARNCRVIEMPESNNRVDLTALMFWLGQHEINEVHVEAGATLSGALLEADCVDELLVYMAPLLLGDAKGMVNLPPLQDLAGARRFRFIDNLPLGSDIRLRARSPGRWRALLEAVSGDGEPSTLA